MFGEGPCRQQTQRVHNHEVYRQSPEHSRFHCGLPIHDLHVVLYYVQHDCFAGSDWDSYQQQRCQLGQPRGIVGRLCTDQALDVSVLVIDATLLAPAHLPDVGDVAGQCGSHVGHESTQATYHRTPDAGTYVSPKLFEVLYELVVPQFV